MPNTLAVGGLLLDLVGVTFLGYDLVRVQNKLREDTSLRRKILDQFIADYGGIESWAEKIKNSSRRISLHEYWDYHAQDEVSYNVDRLIEASKEHASNIEGLASWMTGLIESLDKDATMAEADARNSLRFSYFGMWLIFVGFFFQLLGALQ